MKKANVERLAAARAVYEAVSVADSTLAAALGWSERYLKARAKGQRWTKVPATLAELSRRARRHLELQLSLLEADETTGAKRSAGDDRARGDQMLRIHTALSSLARNMAGETGNEETALREEELADVLTRIDARISELAHEYARELVARQRAGEACADGGGQLATQGAVEAD